MAPCHALLSEVSPCFSLQYLVLFCDVETTGVRINHDHVIEIGAVVFGEAKSHVTNPTFNELIYTDVRIPQIGNVV